MVNGTGVRRAIGEATVVAVVRLATRLAAVLGLAGASLER